MRNLVVFAMVCATITGLFLGARWLLVYAACLLPIPCGPVNVAISTVTGVWLTVTIAATFYDRRQVTLEALGMSDA